MTDKQRGEIINAVQAASAKWQSAFNSGDAAGCAAQYEETATMHARPFGTFTGTAQIQEFWQNIMNDGFADVEYIDPKIEVVDDMSAILTSGWKMNKASGVIHKELWVIQPEGHAQLREDDFEVTG